MLTFPILCQGYNRGRERARWEALSLPRGVPWERVEPHRMQAQANHGQTLERLAERGGLAPEELLAAVTGRGLRCVIGMPLERAVAELRALGIIDPLPASCRP